MILLLKFKDGSAYLKPKEQNKARACARVHTHTYQIGHNENHVIKIILLEERWKD